MLSGVKFVPRDQIQTGRQGGSDSDSSSEYLKGSTTGKGRHDGMSRKKKLRDDDGKKLKKGKKTAKTPKKKKKKWYSSNEDDSSLSNDSSEGISDVEIKTRKSGKSRKRDMESSSSMEDENTGRRRRERRHRKDRRKTSEEDGDDLDSRNDNMLRRKEMGLDWMSMPAKNQDSKSAPKNDIVLEPLSNTDEIQPNPKELNPYYKDNGTGYPDEVCEGESTKIKLPASSLVGDGGASWRLKALKRAREQAIREGRKVDEVVEERWGSMGQLALSVSSHSAAPANAHLRAISSRKRGQNEVGESVKNDETKRGRDARLVQNERKDYLLDVSSRHSQMRKPKRESVPWRKQRDDHNAETALLVSDAVSSINKFANDGTFMDEVTCDKKDEFVSNSSHTKTGESKHSKIYTSKINISNKGSSVTSQGLSSNQLAAKALQLRLKGKHEEADNLLKEVEVMKAKQETGVQMDSSNTNEKIIRHVRREVSSQLKKNKDDADIHLAQKIMKNKQYDMSKRADDEYDFDDDAPIKKRKDRSIKAPVEPYRASNRVFLTQKERCQFCFDNPTRQKHLVVSIAQFTYMMLPLGQSIVQGHCCICPLQHESATRSVDDNVWEEIRNFKKCLVMMFAKEEKSVIFLETVVDLAKQRRHCLVECIPLPHDLAKEAPLYFKKAIDEAEDEWSQHNAKKLIYTTREKGLRRSVPKDFPYFHVEFGLDDGFVHVIDDEATFKSGLALNVIRGMLKLPEEDMYCRRRHETMENQRLAVAAFGRNWDPFDWTKQLG